MPTPLIANGFFGSGILGHLGGNFYSISTQIVSFGGASTIQFNSIPQTYTHLQLHIFAQTSRSGAITDGMNIQFNGDTGSNYSQHWLQGNGSAATAYGYASQTRGWLGGSGGASGYFSANIVDILDYTNTNKYKTHRYLMGTDANGSGLIEIGSGVWFKSGTGSNISDPISSFTILPDYSPYVQYSSFALYGVK